jgi:hypothetical protein
LCKRGDLLGIALPALQKKQAVDSAHVCPEQIKDCKVVDGAEKMWHKFALVSSKT